MNPLHARAFLPALLILGAASVGILSPAAAAPANEAHCRMVGADAGRLAVLRDAGRPVDASVATVAAGPGRPNPEALREAAALLFARFRLMSPENAEFEFYLDCLDDEAVTAAPAGMHTDTAAPR